MGTYQEPGGLVVQGHVNLSHAIPHLVEGRLGHAQRIYPTVWVPWSPSHPSQVGTSVMAIFFLSKDSRICCSSFWERGRVWAWAEPEGGQLLPLHPPGMAA